MNVYNNPATYCVLWYMQTYDEGSANYTLDFHQAYGPFRHADAAEFRRRMIEDWTVPEGSKVTIVPIDKW